MPPPKPSLLFRQLRPSFKARHTFFCRHVTTVPNPNPPPPPPAAYTHLSTRRLISLHGPDAAHFLQGLITQKLRPASQPPGIYSAFLNASGRVLYDVFIYQGHTVLQNNEAKTEYLIEVDANEVEALARHLKRFKLRAKIGIRVMEEGEYGVWAAWGDEQCGMIKNGTGCPDHRAPELGERIALRHDGKFPHRGEEVPASIYEVRRMMMGVAEGQGEILKESALPQESNIDYMGGIDFRKGCYVGQELTIRTHHTGVVRKRILPVQIYSCEYNTQPPALLSYDQRTKVVLPPRGANISRADKKGRSAGKWLGGVGNVGLALCRLEVMTDTVLTGEGTQWSPEHEFKVAWEPEEGREGGEVKVKAFVPSWHKMRAEGQKLHRT